MTDKQLDLLLVNANARDGVYGTLADLAAVEPPVWAGLIARYCLDRGFTVAILDAEAEGLTVGETAARIWAQQPRLAAFCVYGHQPSASTQCLPAASAVARELRKMTSTLMPYTIPTLALGTHPSALPFETMREEPFNYVVEGEGHVTLMTLLERLRATPQRARVGVDIPGLWQRSTPPEPVAFYNRRAPALAADLDAELPGQAWGLLDLRRYRAHNWHLWTGDPAGGYASVQTSLSCPFKCSFCCIAAPFGGAGQGYRKWSPANVAAQIANLVLERGITNVKIPDEMFCLDRSHVWQICNLLIDMDLGEKLNMWAYARVDTVKDEQMLERMRRAGFRWLGIGIESASAHVRDGVEKGRFGNEQIVAAVRRVEAHDINVAANYIFGLPDDTRESCAETLALALELDTAMANFYCAMAYPGSALHQQVLNERTMPGYGRLAQGLHRLPEDPGGPGWLGYSQHAACSLPLATATLSSEELLDIRDDAWLAYFRRPEFAAATRARFGDRAAAEVARMVSYGKPHRNHRKEQ